METLTSQKNFSASPDGNQNGVTQMPSHNDVPPPYSAYPQEVSVVPAQGNLPNAEPIQQSALPSGYLTARGQYYVTPPHPTFPLVAINQQAASRTICVARSMKVLAVLGISFLVAALAFYTKAQRNGDYDEDDDPNNISRVIPLAFMSIGLVFLLVGLVGVAVMYRSEQRRRAEGYATLSAAPLSVPNLQIYPQTNQVVQGVPFRYSHPPEDATSPSLYPRQQYTTVSTNL